MKTAIITGVCGQTGSYLAELLLEKGYRVIGVRRRTSAPNNENIENCLQNNNFELVVGDITDYSFVNHIVNKTRYESWENNVCVHPLEIYNLAAQSFVKSSFETPFHTFDVDTIGVLNFLEVLKEIPKSEAKFYQASTSEMFGKSFSERGSKYFKGIGCLDGEVIPLPQYEKYQDENTPFMPQSPYGIAKLAAHHLCRLYRQSYGIHACCGILFNHESPRRGKEFVTRKITDYVGQIAFYINDKENRPNVIDNLKKTFTKLKLGNLDSYRDWGHAKDYARAQHLILQQDSPDDFVICMEETHTVREFCDAAFKVIGLDYNDYVEVDPQFYRPSEVDFLRGDCTKAKSVLNWKPEYTFEQLVQEMVSADIERYNHE